MDPFNLNLMQLVTLLIREDEPVPMSNGVDFFCDCANCDSATREPLFVRQNLCEFATGSRTRAILKL